MDGPGLKLSGLADGGGLGELDTGKFASIYRNWEKSYTSLGFVNSTVGLALRTGHSPVFGARLREPWI